MAKAERSGRGAVKLFNLLERTALRMASTALEAAAQSGQISEVPKKNKRFLFLQEQELAIYATELFKSQQRLCELTRLEMLLDGVEGDPELRCSLDRVDSSGHYERGNLRAVCKFANRWEGTSENEEFKRLIKKLRARD